MRTSKRRGDFGTASKPRVAVYLRVSTIDQSHASQEREVMEYCGRRGWPRPAIYRDKTSGAKTTRPHLDKLIQDVRAGRIDVVVSWKLDRLGRSLTHLALIIEELARAGVALICTSQGIDTSSNNPVGKLQLGVLMAVAEFERDMLRERVAAGLKVARSRGVRLGRPPHNAGKIQKAHALAAQIGPKVREIARRLGLSPSVVSRALRSK